MLKIFWTQKFFFFFKKSELSNCGMGGFSYIYIYIYTLFKNF